MASRAAANFAFCVSAGAGHFCCSLATLWWDSDGRGNPSFSLAVLLGVGFSLIVAGWSALGIIAGQCLPVRNRRRLGLPIAAALALSANLFLALILYSIDDTVLSINTTVMSMMIDYMPRLHVMFYLEAAYWVTVSAIATSGLVGVRPDILGRDA